MLVDPTDDVPVRVQRVRRSCFVYGTYFGISPYRMADGGAFFFNNQSITNGINLNDRSEFYIPIAMNKDNPSQLFLGTYRLYRTNNARTPKAGDVRWTNISPGSHRRLSRHRAERGARLLHLGDRRRRR